MLYRWVEGEPERLESIEAEREVDHKNVESKTGTEQGSNESQVGRVVM